MPLTIYAQNKLIAHLFSGQTYLQPLSYTVGLFSVSPSQAAGGTELAGSGYTRQPITFDVPFDDPTLPMTNTVNLTAIVFPQSTANWLTAVAYGIFDEAGTLLVYNPMNPTIQVLAGQLLTIAAGNLEVDWSL